MSISEKQLGFLIQARELRYVNIGLGEKRERRRFDPADIDEFIERRKSFGLASTKTPHVHSRSSYYPVYDFEEIRASLKKKKGSRK